MLTKKQIKILQEYIECYDFPCAVYDFKKDCMLSFNNMKKVEQFIKRELTSSSASEVKDGLSNVLYWGYMTSGYRDHRVSEFIKRVTVKQLNSFIKLITSNPKPSVHELSQLKMPQYSGISFLSKIRMFLNSKTSATLDKQIMKMKFTEYGNLTVLADFSHNQNEGAIRPSKPNSQAYEQWCERLIEISRIYFENKYRAVDIERGFFSMIRKGKAEEAAKILADA